MFTSPRSPTLRYGNCGQCKFAYIHAFAEQLSERGWDVCYFDYLSTFVSVLLSTLVVLHAHFSQVNFCYGFKHGRYM